MPKQQVPRIVANRRYDYFGFPVSNGIRGILAVHGFTGRQSLDRTVKYKIGQPDRRAIITAVASNRLRIL